MPFQSGFSTGSRDVVLRIKPSRPAWIVAILAAGLAAGAAGLMTACSNSKPPRTMRFSTTLPAGDYFGASNWFSSVALSPDGSTIVYVATHEGVAQLYVRRVGEWDAHILPGTFGATTPVFSPDGQWVAAVAGRKLVKIPISGGTPVVLAPVPFPVYGGWWTDDGTIYLGTEAPLGLVKVQAVGGQVLGATAVERRKRETDHRFPEVLPGGKWLMFTAKNASEPTFDQSEIQVISLRDPTERILIKGGSNAHFVAPGHLVFMRSGNLMVVPFDPVKAELKGAPVALLENVMENPRIGAGQYSVSAEGSLVYLQGGVTFGERELVSVDRSGTTRVLTARKRAYQDVALSPDGRMIATTIDGPTSGTYLHDIAHDTDTRFSTGGSERRTPAWSGDGKRLLSFGYDKDGYSIFWKPLEGTGKEEEVLDSEEAPSWPTFMSKDGKSLIYVAENSSGLHTTSLLMFGGPLPFPHPLIAGPSDREWGQISPDGNWLAYNTDESGRQEVYVATFPKLESVLKVSTEGGRHPQWSPDGKEIFFRQAASAQDPRPVSQRVKMMAVSVETKPSFKAGTPHMLFQGPFYDSNKDFAVTPDGKGFILIREDPAASAPTELKVVLNWNEELKRRMPAN